MIIFILLCCINIQEFHHKSAIAIKLTFSSVFLNTIGKHAFLRVSTEKSLFNRNSWKNFAFCLLAKWNSEISIETFEI